MQIWWTGRSGSSSGAGRWDPCRGAALAIDTHLIRRYDEKFGDELVPSRARGIMGVFERHVTVQITDAGRRLTIAVVPMRAHEGKEDAVRRLLEAAHGAGIKNAMFHPDREFFAAAVHADSTIRARNTSCRAGGDAPRKGCLWRICGRQARPRL